MKGKKKKRSKKGRGNQRKDRIRERFPKSYVKKCGGAKGGKGEGRNRIAKPV